MPNLPPEEFTARFLARMPPHLANSFTMEQLQGIQRAFGMRYCSSHRIQIRRTFHFLSWTFYFFAVAGRDRRRMAVPWPDQPFQ
jgi:hypothetical protein